MPGVVGGVDQKHGCLDNEVCGVDRAASLVTEWCALLDDSVFIRCRRASPGRSSPPPSVKLTGFSALPANSSSRYARKTSNNHPRVA